MNLLNTLAIIFLILYFLPSILAVCRSTNVIAVILINLFLGWTFVGWLVALFLSLSSPTTKNINITNTVHTTVGNNKKPVNIIKTPHKQKIDYERCFLITKKVCIQNKKIILGTIITVIGVFVFAAFISALYVYQEQKEFYNMIDVYESKSPVLSELFDCKFFVNESWRYEFCRCLYEYSVKISSLYAEEKYNILNADYDYSHQKQKALERFYNKYYQNGIDVCENAI